MNLHACVLCCCGVSGCVPECPVVVVVVVVVVFFVSQSPCTSTSMGPLECHVCEDGRRSLEGEQNWSEAV